MKQIFAETQFSVVKGTRVVAQHGNATRGGAGNHPRLEQVLKPLAE